MSKMKDLQMTLNQMIQCGEGMIAAANALKKIFSGNTCSKEDGQRTRSTEERNPAYRYSRCTCREI